MINLSVKIACIFTCEDITFLLSWYFTDVYIIKVYKRAPSIYEVSLSIQPEWPDLLSWRGSRRFFPHPFVKTKFFISLSFLRLKTIFSLIIPTQ